MCRFLPGDDMREQELAERYAVSRQPVREALLRLEREHLVTVQPRQGYRVNPISISDARDLLRFRYAVEPACVSEAIEQPRTTSCADWTNTGRSTAGGRFHRLQPRLPLALAQASGNRRMASALRDLIEQADRLVRVSIANVKGRDPMQLVAEHVSLIDAMQRRDARSAARIIKAHIEKTRKTRAACARRATRHRRRERS